MVSYIETTYRPATCVEDSLMLCGYRRYALMAAGVLCRAVAHQGCYEETI